jgi:hypothetical protein
VSVHGPPWLYFEPPQLLNFDFVATPEPALHTDSRETQRNVVYLG